MNDLAFFAAKILGCPGGALHFRKGAAASLIWEGDLRWGTGRLNWWINPEWLPEVESVSKKPVVKKSRDGETKINTLRKYFKKDSKYTQDEIISFINEAGYQEPKKFFNSIVKEGSTYGPGQLIRKDGDKYIVL